MSKSKWPNDGLQLDVTCYAANVGKKGEDKSLSIEQHENNRKSVLFPFDNIDTDDVALALVMARASMHEGTD